MTTLLPRRSSSMVVVISLVLVLLLSPWFCSCEVAIADDDSFAAEVVSAELLQSDGIGSSMGTTTPHAEVVQLTASDFDAHVALGGDALWLIEFYAPWCGHCVRLAPILEDVAPILAGKMSIGKVDCTVETSLCKKYNVRGYPTLKYIRNGNGPAAQDYTSGRDADSIIEFANKMTRPAVSLITTSYNDAIETLYYGQSNAVAYIIHDPNVNDPTSLFVHKLIDNSGASYEEKEIMKIIKATERTREYEHVADKLKDRASFGLLHPNLMSHDEIRKFFTSHTTTITTTTTTNNDDENDNSSSSTNDGHVDGQFFLARIERGMPPLLYTGDPKSSKDIETFVTSTNLPTVLEVSPRNFNFISRRGKPLIMGVYDPSTTSRVKVQTELRHYAIHGQYKDEYLYAIIDGSRWDKFLIQFYVHKVNKSNGGTVITQYIAIDRRKGFYWHDKSVATASDFISGIKNGTIHIRAMKKPSKYETPALWKTFMKYTPYSIVGVFVLFGIVFYLAVVFDRKFIANEFTNSSTTTTTTTNRSGKGGGGGGLESTKEYQQMMKEEAAVETKKDQ